MHFKGRDLKPYGDFVRVSALVEGRVYFRVSFLDQDMAIPEMVPLVYMGRNVHPDQAGLYFQDAASYLGGDRLDLETLRSGQLAEDEGPLGAHHRRLEPWCEVLTDGEFTNVYEFEPGLESLLACSLRRHAWNGVIRPCTPAPEAE